jgi:hypothetical protein
MQSNMPRLTRQPPHHFVSTQAPASSPAPPLVDRGGGRRVCSSWLPMTLLRARAPLC